MIACAGAVPGPFNLHRRQWSKAIADRSENRRTGRRNKLPFDVARIYWFSRQQLGHGRRRNRETTMGHFNHAAADTQWRRNELLDAKQLETDRGPADIDNRIETAYFMKMNLLDRLVVYARFGGGQKREDARSAVLNALSQPGFIDDLENVAQMTVRMFVRRMYVSICRPNAGTINLLEINLPISDFQRFQLRDQYLRVDTGTDQCAKNHVAAGSGKTIKVKSFHKGLVSRKKAQKV